MLIRATIVLLVVLNLGAAAWWLWHPTTVAEPAAGAAGVPRLVLLDEVATADAAEPAPAAETMPAPQPAAADAEPAEDAGDEPVDADGPDAASLSGEPRCEDGGGTGGWRVYLPPAADLATAESVARRIAAAGFSDYLVLREGPDANGIALGMFSSEAGAQRRSAALRAQGFPARCARIATSTPA